MTKTTINFWTAEDQEALVANRTAKCSTCRKESPSSNFAKLPFFEFRGENSEPATIQCVCGFYAVAHGEINVLTNRAGITDHEFQSKVFDTDSFYCGCYGWD